MRNIEREHAILSENIPGFRGNESLNDILKFLGIDNSMTTCRRYNNKAKIQRKKFKNQGFGKLKNKKNKGHVISEKKECNEKVSKTVNDHEDFSKYEQNQESDVQICEDQQNATDKTLTHFINSESIFRHELENRFNNFYELNDSLLRFDKTDEDKDFKVVISRKQKSRNHLASKFSSPTDQSSKIREYFGSRIKNSMYKRNHKCNDLKFVPLSQSSQTSHNYLNLMKNNSQLNFKNDLSGVCNGVFYPVTSGNETSAC